MLSTIESLILPIILVIAAVSALLGFWKGIWKQLLRVGVVALCVIASVILANKLAPMLTDVVFEYVSSLEFYKTYQEISDMSASLTPYVYAIIGAIVAPVLFSLIFIVIFWLSKILFGTWSRALLKNQRKGLISRLSGAAVGAVSGALVAVLLLLPINNCLHLIANIEPEALSTVTNETAEENTLTDISATVCQSLMSDKKVLENDFNSKEEIPVILSGALGTVASYNAGGDSQVASVFGLVTAATPYLEKSVPLATIVAEVLKSAVTVWENDGAVFGISFTGELYEKDFVKEKMNSVFGLLRAVNAQNIASTISSLQAELDEVEIWKNKYNRYEPLLNGDTFNFDLYPELDKDILQQIYIDYKHDQALYEQKLLDYVMTVE